MIDIPADFEIREGSDCAVLRHKLRADGLGGLGMASGTMNQSSIDYLVSRMRRERRRDRIFMRYGRDRYREIFDEMRRRGMFI